MNKPEQTGELTRAQQMVRELLEERRELLVHLNRLAGTAPGEAKRAPDPKQLQRFCQLLVDYAATGHFGLYETIRNDSNCQEGVWEQARSLYAEVAATTDALLGFNDKYNCEDHCALGPDLSDDLSAVGEVLATRIELEDRITAPLCAGCEGCLPG
ncbi:MAG: Rsd/AlgQ family anti-sigma factor [Gammaproteobacteria bacterium]|nr:Rsd/AlgQ family anti-sigma factor [Gammaproteobacteria bacterium]